MFSKILKLDWIIILSSFILLGIGLVSLYSISSIDTADEISVFGKQIIFSILSIVALMFFSFMDYHYLKSYSTAIYFGTVVMLVLVLFFGDTIRGTSGWIGIGSFHIQPVEISKIALIIFMASFLSSKKSTLGEISMIVSSFILPAIIIFLVLKQPDFGSAVILSGIWFGMVFLSGIKKRYVFSLIAIFVLTSIFGWFLLADYQKDRVMNLFTPENDPMRSGYNVIQSMVAVGSGGIIGQGIGHGSQSQLNFLPEKHTDFIFAVIAEELGVLGSFFLLFVFGLLFYRMRKIAQLSRDNFGYLIVVGAMIMFFLQILINVGMNVGIMPVTGIPLPFLSYGGSSLISVFAILGIIMNIYIKRKKDSGFQVVQSY